MSKRDYHQYCPLAYGLNIVGERWTLLLLRELGLGARRFTDLGRGLPGMGANLLSNRLKQLEMDGLVASVALPPPARGFAYQLTEKGEQLLSALRPLTIWGLNFMPAQIPDDDYLGAVPAMLALKVLFDPKMPAEESISIQLHLQPDTFWAMVENRQLSIQQGFAQNADVAIQTKPSVLMRLATQRLSVSEAIAAGELMVERGSEPDVDLFFAQFDPVAPKTLTDISS